MKGQRIWEPTVHAHCTGAPEQRQHNLRTFLLRTKADVIRRKHCPVIAMVTYSGSARCVWYKSSVASLVSFEHHRIVQS